METSRIRNVAVIGPHGVGKTTLVEAMLYDMAMIPSRGRVAKGTATTDFDAEEIQRGLSVGTGLAWGEWRGMGITLLDTPGHGDFAADARLAMAAADAALLVVSAAKGIDANVRKSYRLANEARLPVLVFINGIEADGAQDYTELLAAIREQLGVQAVPLELPLGRGRTYNGEVDLVGMRTWYFMPGTGEVTEVGEVPGEWAEEARRYHTELVEAIAERHDELLERYLNGQEPDRDELWTMLKRDLLESKVLPVLCGSAQANLAIRPLLDAVVDLLPSPLERTYPDLLDVDTQARVPLAPLPDAPVALTIFKTFVDPYLGKISAFRVLRGTVGVDTHLVDVRQGTSERLGRLFRMIGKKTLPVERLGPGEIGAVAKLKEAPTGVTLVADGHHPRLLQYAMPRIAPAIWSIAIAPVAKQDEARLAVSLAKLKEEDPALTVSVEPRTHRTVIAGQGPLHLEVALARLRNRYHVEVSQADPRIPYRETVTTTAKGQGRHKKQTGGRGQFADVWLEIEPLPRGQGFQFVDAVVGGAVPRPYIPAVEKGVRETLEAGLLAGCPIVDVKVTLYDGSAHAVDSSEMAFKIAAHLAMRGIFAQANPLLLEPIMEVSVTVPLEAMGDAMADLNTRRGQIETVEGATIQARLPLVELAGLAAEIQGYTRGQGTIELAFRGYQEVPANLQAPLVAQLKAESLTTR